MKALHDLKSAIERAVHPSTAAEFEEFRKELLSHVESAIGNDVDRGEARHDRLSPREHEVMTMLLEGRRLKEIAARLDISVKTVTTHRARLLRKLQINDNLGLYRYGIRSGLISV